MGASDLSNDYYTYSHINGNPDPHAAGHAREFAGSFQDAFSRVENNGFSGHNYSPPFPYALKPFLRIYIFFLYGIFTLLIYSML